MVYSNNEKLTSFAFEMTTGLLLGDGNLQKPKTCCNYRFRFSQNSKRKDYVWHVFKKYQQGLKLFDKHTLCKKYGRLINREEPRIYQYITKKNKLNCLSMNFETRITSAFSEHARIFYSNNSSKKNLCSNLTCFFDLLTPTALAYWYMDDGSWPNKNSKTFLLCTHAYTSDQTLFFSKLLNKKFGLLTTVHYNRNQPIIQISAKCYPTFHNLIYPTLSLIPSMQTKFPI